MGRSVPDGGYGSATLMSKAGGALADGMGFRWANTEGTERSIYKGNGIHKTCEMATRT